MDIVLIKPLNCTLSLTFPLLLIIPCTVNIIGIIEEELFECHKNSKTSKDKKHNYTAACTVLDSLHPYILFKVTGNYLESSPLIIGCTAFLPWHSAPTFC